MLLGTTPSGIMKPLVILRLMIFLGRRDKILKKRIEIKVKTILERKYYDGKITKTEAEIAL